MVQECRAGAGWGARVIAILTFFEAGSLTSEAGAGSLERRADLLEDVLSGTLASFFESVFDLGAMMRKADSLSMG